MTVGWCRLLWDCTKGLKWSCEWAENRSVSLHLGKAVMEYHGCSLVKGLTYGHSSYLEAMPLQIHSTPHAYAWHNIQTSKEIYVDDPLKLKSNPKITTWERPESFLIIKRSQQLPISIFEFQTFQWPIPASAREPGRVFVALARFLRKVTEPSRNTEVLEVGSLFLFCFLICGDWEGDGLTWEYIFSMDRCVHLWLRFGQGCGHLVGGAWLFLDLDPQLQILVMLVDQLESTVEKEHEDIQKPTKIDRAPFLTATLHQTTPTSGLVWRASKPS